MWDQFLIQKIDEQLYNVIYDLVIFQIVTESYVGQFVAFFSKFYRHQFKDYFYSHVATWPGIVTAPSKFVLCPPPKKI